ncbi:hypothetical protein KBY83_12625 [Cyanobium sp. WKJ7-Wakatipu]|uniref:hypothetical protein n=1 Tax=Cyanobium sp. WKJ7-Wakatipu TaxID=2823726 RepID=UPI0020CCB50F|nr:hypothetical protein [Cyanobium sp. WKJ7-Wakatipu]MCP9784145.1 hypothetical protein [Cyanobium sp. WKJ7-Wakatipu]
MPCPRTPAELIAQTWPTLKEKMEVESYLREVFNERGPGFLQAPSQRHWIGAQADIERLQRRKRAPRLVGTEQQQLDIG